MLINAGSGKKPIKSNFEINMENITYRKIREFIESCYKDGYFEINNKSEESYYYIGDFKAIIIPLVGFLDNKMKQHYIQIVTSGIKKDDTIFINSPRIKIIYKDLIYYIDSGLNLCIYKLKEPIISISKNILKRKRRIGRNI